MLSRFYNLATARNSASAVVAVAVVWTLARKASANQRRRFWSFVFNIFKCRFGVWELVQKGVSIGGVGKMRNCGMRNAESKMRNGPCGKVPRNGV